MLETAEQMVLLHICQRGGDVLPVVAAVPLGVLQGIDVAHADPLSGDGIVIPAAGVQDRGELLRIVETGVHLVTVHRIDLTHQGFPVLVVRKTGHEFVRQHCTVPGIQIDPCVPSPVFGGQLYIVFVKKIHAPVAVVGYPFDPRFVTILEELEHRARLPPEITETVSRGYVARLLGIPEDDTVVTHQPGIAIVLEIPDGTDDRQICQIHILRVYRL